MADLRIGQTLSHYEILEKLGEGGMGVVYKARDIRLERLVAIKILPPERVADADRTRRFVQEAKAVSALNHPNIVTIYEIADTNGADFMVMEYVAGKTLDETIRRHGLRLSEALKFAVQMADALAAAHAAGIVHRDVKPSNVMVSDKGHVKVLDFGLAKLTERAESDEAATRTLQGVASPMTEEGTVLGTVAYMSPEQAEGRKLDARSDIFSFGSTLFEMVTGCKAFQGDSRLSTLSAILRDDPKPPAGSNAIPLDLQKIISRCLRKDPARRFQTMADLKVALEEVKEESDSGLSSEAVPTPRDRSRPLLIYATGALALALGVTGGLWWWNSRSPAAGTGPTRAGLTLRQLTQESGRTTDPAISPDGKLLVYASDRAGDGGLELWMQQLTSGSQPIRLTRDHVDNTGPSFSPDGGRIVFSSSRDGGGVYVMPALGGEERQLLRGPYFDPRFSPDGQWVGAWAFLNFQGRISIVPADGGAPRTIAPDFYDARNPIWSPDGKHILFAGGRQQGDPFDWWVAPVDGGPVVNTQAANVLAKLAGGGRLNPTEWIGDDLLFSAGNLWRVPLSRDFKVGTPVRLTTSTDLEVGPRAVSGSNGWRIVFSSGRVSSTLWSLPIDHNAAKTGGEPMRMFPDALPRTTPSLSADGSRLTYVSRGLDGFGVRLRNMNSGAETTLVQSPVDMRARLSPDGSAVAYNPTSSNEKERVIFLIPAAGGEARKLCDTCGLIYDWTPDGKSITYRTGNPMRFARIEVATGRQVDIVADPKHSIYGALPSPDQRWIAIQYGGIDAPPGVFIAPAGTDGIARPSAEWIRVAERPGPNPRPWWSPDGNVVYYLSGPGAAQVSIWARRLDPRTKQPRGEVFLVWAPSAQRSLRASHVFGPAIGDRRLIFPIWESTGNIWLAE